jgi:hypothetical protein
MTTHFPKVLESKAAHRRKLAELPIGEKLRLLDVMRERAIVIIRNASPEPDSSPASINPCRCLPQFLTEGLARRP